MKTTVDKLSDTRVKLTVNVPFSELDKEIDNAYKAIAQQVTIPGFRKGKAPRQLIDARFGRGPVLEQVVNDMLPVKYEEAMKENDINPIGQPEVDIKQIEDNEFVEFTAEVDVQPEIEVPDFSKINVKVSPLKSLDEATDEQIDQLRDRFGELKETKRQLKTDDFAVIDLTAEIDGKEIEDAKVEAMSYQIGSGNLIKGLDTALRGMKTGEDNSFTAKLQTGEHAGEEAEVSVHVQKTQERKLPAFDDEFAQMASEFDTADELRDSIRAQSEESVKAQQAAEIRDEVLKAALEDVKFELPKTVVDEQVHNQYHQVLGQVGGDEKALAQLLEAQGTSREQFDKEARESAEDSVRTQLFLDAVAEKEQPEVTQEELTEHIMFTARSYGMEPGQFMQQLQQANQLPNLFADVRRGKALAMAICNVSVEDTDGNSVDPKDYFGEEENAENAEGADVDAAAGADNADAQETSEEK
ncbi:trigger factor [Corynebacterium sp. MNWGS58]|uniref:trigger factor n=1 Tax=Corynebacterium sp. 102791.4 TaxID=3104612 RepID=UPI003518D3DB